MDTPPPPKKLLDQMRDALRVKHYALSTENSYVGWADRFIRFHKMRHPNTMGEPEFAAFLTHLAVEENIAAPTHSQALSAILFLYRHVLHLDLEGRIDLVRAKKSRHLPVVLTKAEVQAVLCQVPNEYQVMAKLLGNCSACHSERSEESRRNRAETLRLPLHCVQGMAQGDRDKRASSESPVPILNKLPALTAATLAASTSIGRKRQRMFERM